MSKSVSAGLLMYSRTAPWRVLLAHPGGPFFAKKDKGAWTIPKGLASVDETDLLSTAMREFVEETGYTLDEIAEYQPLGSVQLKGGKEVHAWAFAGDWEHGRRPESNLFEMEWPPRSGQRQSFPEIDRAEMFALDEAKQKINERQLPFIDRLWEILTALEANQQST